MKPSALPKWKARLFGLAAFFILIPVTLLLAELLVRIVAPQNLSGTWFEKSARGNDINKANWTSRQQFGNRTVVYRINSLHLRGGPVGGGTNRVLCLGDSFTFGWLLDETNTFVYKLNQLAARDFPPGAFEFLNGGSGGWGTADYVAFAEDFGRQIHPAAIVVFLNGDDVGRTARSSLFQLEATNGYAVTAAQTNASKRTIRDIFRSFGIYQWTLQHSHLFQFLRVQIRVRSNQNKPAGPAGQLLAEHPESAVRLTEALFLRLRQWCRDNDCRLFVVTTGFQAFPGFPLGRESRTANQDFYNAAAPFFATNQIAFHDNGPELSGAMKGDFSPLVIANEYHPNEHGSEAVATLTWAWLEPQLRQMLDSRPPGRENRP